MSSSETIIFTKSNLVKSDAKNVYKVDFPVSTLMKDKSIALSSITIPNSWFNITSQNTSAKFGNNTFSFTYPDGATNPTHNIVLQDGNYSVADVNEFIQFYCRENNLYVIDADGNNVYFLALSVNAPIYRLQFDSFQVYTAGNLPTGYTLPPGAPAPPTVNNTNPQLIISPIISPFLGFATYSGFNAGTYPALPTYNARYSVRSQNSPSVSTVSNVFVLCNIASNRYNPSTSQVISSFNTLGAPFGTYIFFEPNTNNWVHCSGQQKNFITVSFVDNNFNPLYINDTDLIVNILIRDD